MDLRRWGRRALNVSIWITLAGLVALPTPSAASQSICPTGGPGPGDPHPGPAVPFIGGTISSDSGAPIAGAAVHLVRCQAGTPSLAGTATTPLDGTYKFDGLTAGASYVVFVPLDGVLGSLVPTASTHNPSWLIDAALGDDKVNMAFR